MSNTIHKVKRGDTGRAWTDTLTIGGSAINLTSCSVNLIVKKPGASPLTRTATITDAAAGTVSYTPVAGDVDTVGLVECEWEIVYSSGATLTVPNDENIQIQVLYDLNPT